MAMTIIDYLQITRDQTILDFGCSKGFLVKALRILYRQAWGVDISPYAIENVDSAVKEYCFLKEQKSPPYWRCGLKPGVFDLCIAKDVFEHINTTDLCFELEELKARFLFAIIPLGRNGKYIAPLNDCDITHVLCNDEDWWTALFKENGWDPITFTFKLPGIKDHYYDNYPKAHGFFLLKNSRF
jgi:SAM-dependent methyltransferase